MSNSHLVRTQADDGRLVRLLGTPLPPSLAETAEGIRVRQTRRHHLALEGAVLIWHARRFFDTPAEWLSWCQAQFGYQKRFCYTAVNAVHGLLAAERLGVVHPDALLGCALMVLEGMYSLCKGVDGGASRLRGFLQRHAHDLQAMTRDEARDALKCYRNGGRKSSPAEEKADADADAPAQLDFLDVLDQLADLSDTKRAEISTKKGPDVCINAAFALLEAGLAGLERSPGASPEHYELLLGGLRAAEDRARELCPSAEATLLGLSPAEATALGLDS